MNKTTVLLCKCRGEKFKNCDYSTIENHLSGLLIDLIVVDDLCATVLTHADELNRLNKNDRKIVILACKPRAVKHLFIQNKIELLNQHVINVRDNASNAALDELTPLTENGKSTRRSIISPLEVPSWYPVIDKDRCTNCGRCAKFCLFGVYTFNGEKLHVQNPLHCKNNCPACARTCPASAILFPKIAEGGVISGDEPGDKKITFTQGNLTSRLSDRQNLRASILKPSVIELAEKERIAALRNIQIQEKKHD
jgi:ferredoxin